MVMLNHTVVSTSSSIKRILWHLNRTRCRFQELARASKLRAFRIDACMVAKGRLRQKCVILSHRWQKKHHPDAAGKQLVEFQTVAVTYSEAVWFWADYMCLPQNVMNERGEITLPRTDSQESYFRKSLNNVNLLYLGGNVVILNDRDYARRFWCLLEAYLSMRKADSSGLVSSLDDPHHSIVCMGSLVKNAMTMRRSSRRT